MASSIVPAPHHEQHRNVDICSFSFRCEHRRLPLKSLYYLDPSQLFLSSTSAGWFKIKSYHSIPFSRLNFLLFLFPSLLLGFLLSIEPWYQIAVPDLFTGSEVVWCVQNVQLLQELLHLQHLYSARFSFPPHILGREQRKSLSEWASWQVHNRCWEMSPMRSLSSWSCRHASLAAAIRIIQD